MIPTNTSNIELIRLEEYNPAQTDISKLLAERLEVSEDNQESILELEQTIINLEEDIEDNDYKVTGHDEVMDRFEKFIQKHIDGQLYVFDHGGLHDHCLMVEEFAEDLVKENSKQTRKQLKLEAENQDLKNQVMLLKAVIEGPTRRAKEESDQAKEAKRIREIHNKWNQN